MVLREVYNSFFTTELKGKKFFPNTAIAFPIVISYLLFVLWIGPTYMKSRKPYNLKVILILYNFLQAFLNGFAFYEGFTGMVEFWHMRCMVKKNPNIDLFVRALFMPFYHYYLLKFLDLLDTVFFVLRKKSNQITFLHVVHHAGFCFMLSAFFPHAYKAVGFYAFLAFLTNAAIHVIMYTYYGLAAFGPSLQKYLWWKKYLTLLQIAQFLFILAYMIVGFLTGCEEFGSFEKMAFSFVTLNFILFVNFYKKYKKD